MTEEEKSVVEQFMIPFFHLKKRVPLFPGGESNVAEATIFGLTEVELKQSRANFEANAKQAALELLKEDEIVELIDQLPFDGSETIVAFGDSATEDDQGWFNILRNILEISTQDASFTFINAGVSGNTTSEALRRIDRDVLVHQPDWVLVELGTFDVQRLNVLPNRTLLPLSETWENLNSIQEILAEYVNNPPIWITPSQIVQNLAESHPLHEFSINRSDLIKVTELVAGKSGGIADPKGVRMGENEPKAWNFLTDGLSPSLSGHMNTVREVLRTLVEVQTNY
jgi:lysophospholipase L1-like esterase